MISRLMNGSVRKQGRQCCCYALIARNVIYQKKLLYTKNHECSWFIHENMLIWSASWGGWWCHITLITHTWNHRPPHLLQFGFNVLNNRTPQHDSYCQRLMEKNLPQFSAVDLCIFLLIINTRIKCGHLHGVFLVYLFISTRAITVAFSAATGWVITAGTVTVAEDGMACLIWRRWVLRGFAAGTVTVASVWKSCGG